MIRFGEDVCRNVDSALRCEWLETNGIGGFASGTIHGCNTRHYHGLLVAATKPPVGRFVLLSKLEETLTVNGSTYELGTNRYPGMVHPQGFLFLTQFRLDPFPVFTFSVAGVELEKTFFMAHGQNTTIIKYQWINAPSAAHVQLELRPLIAFRDYFRGTFGRWGLGHISEIFDGDGPHRPVGCMAQAWSAAEILRAAVEDVRGIRPERPAALLDAVAQ